jgi:hypothetical protein
VQESKDNTGRVLREVETQGRLPSLPMLTPKQALTQLLEQAAPHRYLAILAYTTPSPQLDASIRALRKAVMRRHQIATTAGYGPRYLHSTGQLHKGGPNSGLFLEFVDNMKPDVPVPEKFYSFGTGPGASHRRPSIVTDASTSGRPHRSWVQSRTHYPKPDCHAHAGQSRSS